MTLSAETLYDRAVADSNAGRLTTARRRLTAAIARAPDEDLAARIDGTLAYLDAETVDPAAALLRIRTAAARPGISAQTRAILLGQAGLVAMRRGDVDAALHDLGLAIGRLRTVPSVLGNLALNRGDVHLQRGDLRRAADDFAVAERAFTETGMTVDAAKARHNLGYTALLAGDLVLAIREMDAAREVLVGVSPLVAAVCDTDRAAALLAAGMPIDAARLLADAVRRYGQAGVRQQQAEAELVLAGTLIHSDPARAAAVARRAATRFRGRGATSWAVRADGWAISAAVLAGTPIAAEELDAVATRLRSIGAGEERARVVLAGASRRIDAGELGLAAAALRRTAASRSTAMPVRLLARQVRTDLHLARGRPDLALRAAAAGLDELAVAQAALGSVDLRSSLVLHAVPLLERGLVTALELDRADLLLEWTERARDVVARPQHVDAPPDRRTADDLAQVRRLRAFSPGGSAEERRLLDGLRERTWHETGSGRLLARVRTDHLRHRLAEVGAAAVAYCRVRGRTAAVVVTAAGARIVRLGADDGLGELLGGLRADLELAAAAPVGPIGASVDAALRARLATLDRRLVAPLGLPPACPVVLTVPGALSGIPWGLLPGLSGRPVTVPTSMAEWLRGGMPTALVRAGFLAGPRVPRAQEEIERGAAAWPGATVLQEADVAQATVLATEVDVLHIAAHGRHSAEQPLFAGLELAGGPWFGYEVQRLTRLPSVVVLSACEVGRSAVAWGEETVGMARAWLQAGARCVLASAASVDDDAACEVLPAVHRRLAGGASPAEALAGTASTFVCFGDGVGRIRAGAVAS